MRGLFFIKLWLIIFVRILDALFPTLWVLLIFAWKKTDILRKSPALRFFIVFTVLDLLVRLLIFFSGIPYQTRYLYSFVVCASVFAALGVLGVSEFTSSFLFKYKKINPVALTAFFIGVLFFVHSGKALNWSNDKPWMKDIAKTILNSSSDPDKRILISSVDDPRISYYSKTKYFEFTPPRNDEFVKWAAVSIREPGRSGASPGKVFFKGSGDLNLDFSSSETAEIIVRIPGMVPLPKKNDEDELGKLLPPYEEQEREWARLLMEKYRWYEKIRLPSGFLELEWGDEKPDSIKVVQESMLSREREEVYSGSPENFRICFFQRKDDMLIKIAVLSGKRWNLKGLKLRQSENWYIWETVKKSGRWLPVSYSTRLDVLAERIRKLGGRNVFILVGMKDSEFRDIFARERTDFPFKLAGEFTDRRKGSMSLYQGVSE